MAKLQQETYVLDLSAPLDRLPHSLIHDARQQWRLVNPLSLEVDVPKTQGINLVFETLSEHHIKVDSMRNKTNRLEKLFLDMVDSGEQS